MSSSRYQEEVWIPIGIVSYLWLVAQSHHFPNVVILLTRTGIPLEIAFIIICYFIPGIIVTILPTAILLSTFFLTRRVASESNAEETHLTKGSQQNGLLIGIGVLSTLISFGINEFVVPSANRIGRKAEFIALYKSCGGSGWSNVTHIERSASKNFSRIYYMGMLDGTKSANILVADFIKDHAVKIIKAGSGNFDQSILRLESAKVITFGKHWSKVNLENLTVSDTNNFQSSLRHAHTSLRDMSARDLTDYLNVLKEANTTDNNIFIRLYQRLVSPFDCLFVAFLGAQLAYIFSGRSRGLAYAAAILIIYQGLQVGSEVIGLSGRLDPFFAAALPTIFLALIILILSLNSLKHCARSPQLGLYKADLRFILSLFGMLP